MRIKEGLSFSDYFDDDVPYEVKPVYSTLPGALEEENPVKNYGDDYPLRAKDLYKGLWEDEEDSSTYKAKGYDSYWVDKDGRFHPTHSHYNWATSYLNRLKKNPSSPSSETVYERMFELGFIRVSINSGNKMLHVEYGKIVPNRNQWKQITDFAIEQGYKVHNDNLNRDVELNETLSEDILHNHRDYWMDTKGRLLRSPNTHFEWAIAYLDAHNIPYEVKDSPDEIYTPMFERGFLRIKVGGNRIYVNYLSNRPPSMYQWRVLRDSAIESDMKLVDAPSNNLAGREVELNESVKEFKHNEGEFWLDPEGEFHKSEYGHRFFARNYLDSRKIPHNYSDEYSESENNLRCYMKMYMLGWDRVVIYNGMMYIRNNVNPPNNIQMRNIRDSAIQSGLQLQINGNLQDLMENKTSKYLFIEHMMPDRMDEFKSNLAELFSYLQKKLKLKTIPKVKLVSDEKNAQKVLGKTAYYDPDQMLVVLYITDRHQKDILRSFSHEVIHHWQHENEKLQMGSKKNEGKDPEYAQNDPWLRQMEKQAYLLGNIIFRDWEDGKKAKDRKDGKKAKDRKSGKKFVEQYGTGDVETDSNTPVIKKHYKPNHPYRKHTEGPKHRPVEYDKNGIDERTYSLGNEYPPKKMDYTG